MMNTAKACGAVIAGLALIQSAPGAAVTVDWLQLAPGGSPSGFQLLTDGTVPLASGSLLVNQGASFPGFPNQRALNSSFWSAPVDFVDSVTGLSDVGAIGFRVAPASGAANYTITFSVPAGQSLVLAIGDLFRNATASTAGISIAALSDSGSAAVTLAGIFGWNNGATALTQDLAWNQPAGFLSTTAGANGDSKVAFLEIAPITGPNARLVLSVPNGYAAGTGDSLIIGVGVLIPEPSVFTLAAACGAFALVRRRR